jgi:hypothetical protein
MLSFSKFIENLTCHLSGTEKSGVNLNDYSFINALGSPEISVVPFPGPLARLNTNKELSKVIKKWDYQTARRQLSKESKRYQFSIQK